MAESSEPADRDGGPFTYEVPAEESVSTAVVRAVAAVRGHDSIADIGRSGDCKPLYDVVDPDALEAVYQSLVDQGTDFGRISFTYCGHDVTVVPESVLVS